MGIDDVIERMAALAEELRRDGDGRLAFHNTYLRTTEAVAGALRDGAFADRDWVDRWDVAFAQLYLDALDADRRGDPVPEPWAVAFGAAAAQPDLPAVRHILLGMNAHINYDLPQALLAVISDAEFGDPEVRARREADHRTIDEVLSVRVGAEDAELQQVEPAATWQDRVLQPLNRVATRRFLRESREKVWANALELSKARAAGPDSYAARLAQLEKLCARRVADLVRPGPVLLRLAAGGFGVRLAGEGQRSAYDTGTAGGHAGGRTAGGHTAGGRTAGGRTAGGRAARGRAAGGRMAGLRAAGSRLPRRPGRCPALHEPVLRAAAAHPRRARRPRPRGPARRGLVGGASGTPVRRGQRHRAAGHRAGPAVRLCVRHRRGGGYPSRAAPRPGDGHLRPLGGHRLRAGQPAHRRGTRRTGPLLLHPADRRAPLTQHPVRDHDFGGAPAPPKS